MRSEAATVQIGASPQTACAVVTGLGCWQEWNPLFAEAPRRVAAGKDPSPRRAGFGVLPGLSTDLRSR